jgi:hypothetical protein
MAPIHQSLVTPSETNFSLPRKPLSSQSWDSQKTFHASENEVDFTPVDDGTSKSESATQQRRSGKDSLGRIWLVELTSLILAFVAFATIIVTLIIHQDRPLPKWPSLISINTLIAIFTAIMKASMLLPIAEGVSQMKWLWFREARPLIDLERFDIASRGPWGCVLLLIKRHTNHLAVLGALITITAMAVDPFAQQVIQYDYCSTTAPKTAALIPRTNNYTAGFRALNGGVGHSSGAMNAAFYGQGLFDPPASASSNIRLICPTGNCTFPATPSGISYMSLGMCSSCADISDTITNTTTIVNGSDGKVITTYTNYMLPSNLTISPLGHGLVAATLIETPSQSAVEGMVSQSMIKFEMLMINTNSCSDASILSGCRVWASRCSLAPCVKSYGATVSDGVLHEREISAIPLQYLPVAAGYAYFGIFTNSTVVDGQVRNCTPTKGPTERNTLRMAQGYTWLSQQYFQNISSAPYYSPECAFTLGVGSTDGLGTSLLETYGDQNVTDIEGQYSGQPWMLQLFDNGTAIPETLDTAISGLSNAITAAIRNGGDAVNSVPATGTVMVSQTCIRVHWGWLILPASLLLFSTLFLGCTIWETSMDTMGKAWKSSPLALLFHGFSAETVRSVGSVDRLSEMDATARKLRAQLRWEEHGWKFAEVSDEKLVIGDVGHAVRKVDGGGSRPSTGMFFPPPLK